MGRDKAFLELNGRSLIEIVLERIRTVAAEAIVVTNIPEQYAHLAARLVGDIHPGVGVLGGMHSGLTAAKYEHALIVGCDMPFLNLSLLEYLVSLAPRYDVVVPCVDDLLEPLHAVYSHSCLPLIETQISAGRWQAFSFYPQARVRYVERDVITHFDPELLSLRNVNTPQDWQKVEREFAIRSRIGGRRQRQTQ
jgi:molybdopterin-guanine dinucleotide biosynthesis protein A